MVHSHLTTGADYWDTIANRWESSFSATHEKVRVSAWEGQAHDAAQERTYWDSVRVGNAAGDLRNGARIARKLPSILPDPTQAVPTCR